MEVNRKDITDELRAFNRTDIINELGAPAVLEMCAEECTELAHACLKLARKMRNDNPTPKTQEECINDLCEEMGDVMLSMDMLFDCGLISRESVESWYMEKEARMYQRVAERAFERTKRELDLMGVYMKGE